MIASSAFGRTSDGQAVTRFTLQGSGGLTVEVLDYGAIVQSVSVPDREGRGADVVLGYDDIAGYEQDPFYLGATIGRYANRIREGGFVLDGKRYSLAVNDGPHHLHGGPRGFGKVHWRVRALEDAGLTAIVLEHTSPDGDEGYPGNLEVRVTHAVSDANVLSVEYRARTDRPTPINLTQHSYFNLAGEGSGDVLGHELMMHAGSFTPVDGGLVPTGVLAPVEGTPLDFRRPRRLGERIGDPQLGGTGGYDHNLVLDRPGDGLSPAARVRDPASGRVLEVFTTEPGLQLYSGNFLDVDLGKQGHRYGRYGGFTLETQHFPDAPNHPGFPSTILRPGDTFLSRTEFRFSTGPT